MRALVLVVGLVGCATPHGRESAEDWYDPGSAYDVEEPVAFTDVPYDFTGPTRIADLPVPADFETWFAEDDAPSPDAACADWATTPDLPVEIEGIVTIHPRFYYKTSGCVPDQTIDSDEKYYGSYFVQDASGGFFVLGDSKVAHFDMGDRVRLEVRAVKESFDSLMISSHDVLEVMRGPEPIWYQVRTEALGFDDVAQVVRMEGTVATVPTTFGEIYLDTDQGVRFKMSLDAELSRRGVTWPVGTRLQVTGPVLYSFSEFQIVIMRVGQITEL